MNIKFSNGIEQILSAKKPIAKSWELSFKLLELDNKLLKVMEILENHENLFINRKNPYHNHYHLAEVTWATAYLAKNENFSEKYFDTMVILLMAATFHDADHPGRTNKIPFELEERSMNFFKNWWKNNSLFVENIMNLTPIQVEQSVVELILFTDFIKGKDKVQQDYQNKKDVEYFGLKLTRMKKILNEADLLMHCLPLYGFNKTDLILQESVRLVPEEVKWNLFINMLENEGLKCFNSDAAKKLKIESLIKKSLCFLNENKNLINQTEKLQILLNEKFKNSF